MTTAGREIGAPRKVVCRMASGAYVPASSTSAAALAAARRRRTLTGRGERLRRHRRIGLVGRRTRPLRVATKPRHVALLGLHEVAQGGAEPAVRSLGDPLQVIGRQRLAGGEQLVGGPRVVAEQRDESGIHGRRVRRPGCRRVPVREASGRRFAPRPGGCSCSGDVVRAAVGPPFLPPRRPRSCRGGAVRVPGATIRRMSDLTPRARLRARLHDRPLLADGGMGTLLFSRGVPQRACLDELAATRPELVGGAHREYLEAGAELIVTLSLGANRHRLDAFGLADRVTRLNRRAAQVAREARDVAGRDALVGGSVGPLGVPTHELATLGEARGRALFREQINGLLEGGIDLFVLETHADLEALVWAVDEARRAADLPILASLTFGEELTLPDGTSFAAAAEALAAAGVDAIGVNCGAGPVACLDALESLGAPGHDDPPRSIMPNAGLPQRLEGRFVYAAGADYFAAMTPAMLAAGARIVGGCCGTTPAHVAAMRAVLDAGGTATAEPGAAAVAGVGEGARPPRSGARPAALPQPRSASAEPGAQGVGDAPVRTRLAAALAAGRFVVSVEIDPPRSVRIDRTIEAARLLRDAGVDIVNVSDSAMARVRMGAMAVAFGIQHDLDLECLVHLTTRDRNLMALESELLGAHALGVRNVLALTGDPPRVGDYPTGTGVWDVDSVGLVSVLARLNRGEDQAGSPIGQRAGFTIACALNPTAADASDRVGAAGAQAGGRRAPGDDPAAVCRGPGGGDAGGGAPALRPARLPRPGPAGRPAAGLLAARRVPAQRGAGDRDPRRGAGGDAGGRRAWLGGRHRDGRRAPGGGGGGGGRHLHHAQLRALRAVRGPGPPGARAPRRGGTGSGTGRGTGCGTRGCTGRSAGSGSMIAPSAPARLARLARLDAELAGRILVIDGAMGTLLQEHRFSEADFRGARFADHVRDLRGDNDLLCLTQPDAVRDVHAAYLAAGADIVSTNTFTATRIAQADYGLEPAVVREINVAAARLARAAADDAERADPARPRYVAGSLGPTNRTASISPDVEDPAARNVSWEELATAYRESAEGLLEGGADLLLVETIFDTLNAKAAIFAVRSLAAELGAPVPLVISGTIVDASGRTLSGQTVEAFWHSIRHANPVIVGLNCALGPAQLREHLDVLGRVADRPISAYPNAGLPNDLGGLRRDPRGDGDRDARVGRARPGQRGRRLLRHHPRPRCRHRRGGGRPGAAAGPRGAGGDPPLRPAAGGHPAARQRVRQHRRAHQRHRIPEVRPAHRRRARGRRGGDRPRAGGERGPAHRREHGRGDARRRRRDDALPAAGGGGAGHRGRPGHGRQLQVERAGGRAAPAPGQGSRQLPLAQGGRGGVPAPGPTSAGTTARRSW